MVVIVVRSIFFFFTQKRASEIRLSLVGSEMCLRDRLRLVGQIFD